MDMFILIMGTMTLSTNILTMWMAIILNNNKDIDRFRKHLISWKDFKKVIMDFKHLGNELMNTFGSDAESVRINVSEMIIATLRENRDEIVEIFVDEKEMREGEPELTLDPDKIIARMEGQYR